MIIHADQVGVFKNRYQTDKRSWTDRFVYLLKNQFLDSAVNKTAKFGLVSSSRSKNQEKTEPNQLLNYIYYI